VAYFAGGSCVAGSCPSDRRLKTDIQPFAPVLERMVELQPVHFNWKSSNPAGYRFGSERNAGLIAQEVQQVFPEMVTVDENGYRRVNYGELPFLMLQGIRELKAENDRLHGMINSQQAEIDALKAAVEKLTAESRDRLALASR
jgi:hypothetical protein